MNSTRSSQAYLGAPYQVQNIARQMNLHGGINLNKIHRYQTAFGDPPGGYRPLYMSRDQVRKIVTRVRTDEDYHKQLYGAEPTARPLLDMWRDTSGRKLSELAANTASTAKDLLNALVNGDGIYDFHFHYWHGGLEMSWQAMWINSILTSDVGTEDDKTHVKAAAVLFANVLFDDDFVPMFDGHGLNLGTANMPVQQSEYRDLYALLLSDHAMMRGRVDSARCNALQNLDNTINEFGAHMAGTAHVDASIGPLLSTRQQLKMTGAVDAFKSEDRLAKFAEFYLNLLTPPEPRFGGYRKLILDWRLLDSILRAVWPACYRLRRCQSASELLPDGCVVAVGRHAFRLSRLNHPENRRHYSAGERRLGERYFPRLVHRSANGWVTRNETAVWLVDGDFYRDHAHEDNGSVVIYALGAPLSIDWVACVHPTRPALSCTAS